MTRASPRESTIERYLVRRVHEQRGRALKLQHLRGWPDRLVLLPKYICFIEMKRPVGGRFEPLQLRIHRLIRAMGHHVHVLSTKEQVDAFIDQYSADHELRF